MCYAKILVASERTRRKISHSLALGDIALSRQQIYDDRFFKKLTGTPLTPLGIPIARDLLSHSLFTRLILFGLLIPYQGNARV